MQYVVLVRRLVKFNTGATEKFAPRTANQVSLRVSGPFGFKAAQRAALAALSTHTAQDAQVWSEAQVRVALDKGGLRMELRDALLEAARCLESAPVSLTPATEPA